MVIELQKIKLAGKRKKESHTSRVSWCEEHGNVARAVTRAWRHGEVARAAGEECSKVVHAGARTQRGGAQL